MPNTKSAERRTRNSARKRTQNRSVKSRLKSIEKNLDELIETKKKEEVEQAFRSISSALDKAAKVGVIPAATASRKKSRLAARVAAAAK